MKKLLFLLAVLACLLPAEIGRWGQASVSGGFSIGESLYVDIITSYCSTSVTINGTQIKSNGSIYLNKTSTVADTAINNKIYGAKTGGIAINIDADTSANTAANYIGINMSGSNAINNTNDYFLYLAVNDYWNGGGALFASNLNTGQIYAKNMDFYFTHVGSNNTIFNYTATKKGDFIIRDGNHATGTVNPNAVQGQDSAGTIHWQFSNRGNFFLMETTATTADTTEILDNGINTIVKSDNPVQFTNTINYAADTSTSDTYKAVMSGIAAYVTGMRITFKAVTANTGASTLTINGLAAIPLKSLHDQDPADNYIEAGSIVDCVYDGTNFQMLQPDANP